MAHFFNDGLECEYSLIYQLQHADKRKLYHRHAGHGLQGTSFFFGEQMGRMVGGYNVYQPELTAARRASRSACFLMAGLHLIRVPNVR